MALAGGRAAVLGEQLGNNFSRSACGLKPNANRVQVRRLIHLRRWQGLREGAVYPRLTHAAVWRAKKGFDGRPRRAVGQRSEAQGPSVGQLLSNGGLEVCALKVSPLRFGSLKARGTLVGAIHAVAATLDRPNRHPIGREDWSCFCW